MTRKVPIPMKITRWLSTRICPTIATTPKNNGLPNNPLPLRALLVLSSSLAQIACASEADIHVDPVRHPEVVNATSSAPRRNTHVYECTDHGSVISVTTRLGAGELAVWLPDELGSGYFVLGQVRSASGDRYEGDGVTVWTKGSEALIEAHGERLAGCARNASRSIWEHARLSGVDFKGVGNEPGWSVEIRDRHIDLEYDYGTRFLSGGLSAPPQLDTAGPIDMEAEIDGALLLVTIRRTPCNDTMSGERFESAVTVRLDQRELHGCGRFLDRSGSP